MNQTRRTLLQAILGLFGLGAAKAVAKTDLVAPLWSNESYSEDNAPILIGGSDGRIRMFDAAMGVVNRGGFCSLATIQLADTRDRDTGFVSGSGWMQSLCFDQIAASAKRRNAMIFAESSGPDGTQLVAELMKRCPERVQVVNSSKMLQLYVTHNMEADWLAVDDVDQAAARALALFGQRTLC